MEKEVKKKAIGTRCTLKDIANALGITANTVSRALKGKNYIAPDTNKAIRDKAAELGYFPNMTASSLRSGKTKTICVLYDSLLNPYYSIVTEMLSERFTQYDYSIMMFIENNSDSRMTAGMAYRILSQNAAGLISFIQIDEKIKRLFDGCGVPVLVLGRDSSQHGVDSVCTDDEMGGYLAVKHLIEKGHRDILFFNALDNISCGRKRLEGYKRALDEAGIMFEERKVFTLAKDGRYGYDLFDRAMESELKFTAVFCFNDEVAFEAVNCLRQRGMRCPEDVAIVGYDNIQSTIAFPVRLTTIDTDKEQLADVAAEVLMHKINNTGDMNRPFNKINGVRLVKGETT